MFFGVVEFVGDSLKEVCKVLGILFVLNFGFCFVIGILEMVVIEFVENLSVDIF